MARKRKSRVPEESKIEHEEEDHQESDSEMEDHGESSKGNCLYEVLGVEKTASQQEIRKAYHKLALRLHPDKNPDDKDANEKFQHLQKVMSILGDEEKRALYDETGVVDDDVTVADIEEFEANYRGSDSEKNDLIKLYNEYKGNMKRLFCSMLCSDAHLDSHRFKDILDEAIASGELKEFKPYKKWAKEVSKMKPPTSPLKRRKKSSKNSDSDLFAIISQRKNDRKDKFDSMFNSMIAKYGGQSSSEPTEEEFEAIQKKMESRRSSKKSSR
ncbi:hypothetical protein KSS87_017000 [Heliosperma pusillum]|nr:hypothetical protein KSS87_017000 [Heliosperma pusillum]